MAESKNFGVGVVGGVVLVDPETGLPYKATGGGGGGGDATWDSLTGKPAVIAAGATAEAARSVLDLADVAATGSYSDLADKPSIPDAPTWSTLDGKPAVIAAGETAAAARTAIGAGTSSLAIGTTGSTAKAGNWTPDVADVTGLDTALAGKAPVTPAASVGVDYSIAFSVASGLGARPALPAGATLRIWGGTIADTDPTWMIDGDYRDIPVA